MHRNPKHLKVVRSAKKHVKPFCLVSPGELQSNVYVGFFQIHLLYRPVRDHLRVDDGAELRGRELRGLRRQRVTRFHRSYKCPHTIRFAVIR